MKPLMLTLSCAFVLFSSNISAEPYQVQYRAVGLTPAENDFPSCKAIIAAGESVGDGTYTISPSGSDPFDVYCDMTTDGGGWTRVGYNQDLALVNRFTGSDSWQWLPTDLSYSNGYLEFDKDKVDAIRRVSSEAKQTYVGQCEGMIHYDFPHNTPLLHAIGFAFHDGRTTTYGTNAYDVDITVPSDDCARNDYTTRETVFEIRDIGLPIVDVLTNDNGGSSEIFGAKLIDNPAWFR